MRRRQLLLGLAFASSLPLLVAFGAIDSVLAASHLPEAASHTFADLGHGHPRSVLDQWQAASEVRRKTFAEGSASAAELEWAYLGLDVLFIAAYTTVLLTALRFMRGRLTNALQPVLASLAALPPGPARRALLALLHELTVALRIIRGARYALLALVAADVAEDGLTASFVAKRDFGGAAPLLQITAGLKLGLALVVAVGIAVGAVRVATATGRAGRGAATVWALRAPIVVTVLAALTFLGPVAGEQAADVIRRWVDDRPPALVAALAALLLGLVLCVGAVRILDTTLAARRGRPPWWTSFLIGLVLASVGAARLREDQPGKLEAIGGAALVLFGLLELALGNVPPPKRRYPPAPAARWPALLAAVPLVALGVAAERPALTEWLFAHHRKFGFLLLYALACQLAGWGVAFLLWKRPPGPLPSLFKAGAELDSLLVYVAIASVAVAAIGTWAEPIETAFALGSVGVVLLALVGLALLGWLLTWFAERWDPPSTLAFLRFRSTPVFIAIAAWAVLAASTDSGKYYLARTYFHSLPKAHEATSASASSPLDRWLVRNGLPPTQTVLAREPKTGQRPGVPLVFVATAGGGIRAAFWTEIALSCLFEGSPKDPCAYPDGLMHRRWLFAASGVSGGAVGLSEYAAHVLADESPGDWADRHSAEDQAAPFLAWFLFSDLPSALFQRDGGSDRAEILERTWQESWSGSPRTLATGLREADRLTDAQHPVPFLFLNGTKVQDGCRFETSVLRLAVDARSPRSVDDCLSILALADSSDTSRWALAATSDLLSLCPDPTFDVRLSTAALLAARFPWASPSARIEPCEGASSNRRVNVVDGGYFDNSGAGTISQLWAYLQPEIARYNRRADTCVVPFLIELDNHYAATPNPGPSPRPLETNVPLQTLKSSRNGREAEARQAAILLFGGEIAAGQQAIVEGVHVVRFAALFPLAHPGTEAPLGWTLSNASRDDLEGELIHGARNRATLERLHKWLSPTLACDVQ